MAKERKLPNRESSARKKDEMLGCDDALEGRRLPGDTWYPGSALHEQIESEPTFSYDICENMVGFRDQGSRS